jgi:hypothetical protein
MSAVKRLFNMAMVQCELVLIPDKVQTLTVIHRVTLCTVFVYYHLSVLTLKANS